MQLDTEIDFVRLWTAAQPTVSAFIVSLVPDFHAAQDILQDTAVALVRKHASYDAAQPFLNWAIGVARAEVLAHRRHFAIRRQIFDDDAVEQIAAAFERSGAELNPMSAALESCIKALPAESRRLLALRYESDLKPQEMAATLPGGANRITVSLHRIRQSLRNCVERRLGQKGGRFR